MSIERSERGSITVDNAKLGICYNWRASGASETVLGVVNAKSGICYMYICMYGWYTYTSQTRARVCFFS